MSFLVDTHVFLWFESDSPRLSTRARSLIRRTDQAIYLSAASFWEIAIKRRLGKIVYEGSARAAASAAGFLELAIDAADAETAGALEWSHRDPFDRMLAAQCLNRELTLVTADARLRAQGDIAVIWAGQAPSRLVRGAPGNALAGQAPAPIAGTRRPPSGQGRR